MPFRTVGTAPSSGDKVSRTANFADGRKRIVDCPPIALAASIERWKYQLDMCANGWARSSSSLGLREFLSVGVRVFDSSALLFHDNEQH